MVKKPKVRPEFIESVQEHRDFVKQHYNDPVELSKQNRILRNLKRRYSRQ